MLQSDLCDYSNAYVVVRGKIIVTAANNIDRKNRYVAFESNAPFISYTSKINNVLIDYSENLDIVMPMYRKAIGSL